MGLDLASFALGVAGSFIVWLIIFRRDVAEFIREEYRYRRDGLYVWWVLRKERK